MTTPAASSTLGAPSRWRHELIRVALHPDGPGTLGDLTQVLGQATGAEGALLWTAHGGPGGSTTASVLSCWLDNPVPLESRGMVLPDPVTDRAFRVRSLALPTDLAGDPPTLFGLPVAAALPVDHADGASGALEALTLLGADELAADTFDVAAELVEILPELCGTLRERQTLALVQACHTIQHHADVESREQPLPRERLREHLAQLCQRVAQTLECTEVAVFLQDTPPADGRYPLFAGAGPSSRDGASSAPAPPAGQADGAHLELPVHSGHHVWGLIRCSGPSGSRLHFTSADLALLHPLGTAVAQYWRSWLHRQTLSAENDSWRQLAAGISGLNRRLARELRGTAAWDPRRERGVCEEALGIVQDVMPEATRVVVSRAEPASGAVGRLVPVSSVGADPPAAPSGAGPALAERVFRSHRQAWTTKPDELAREGAGPDTGWLLCTPVGVGDQV